MLLERAQRLSIAADIVGQLYLAAPDATLRAALSDGGLLEDWPLNDPASVSATARLREASANGAEDEEALARDHLYLFVGAGPPLAQPYESPYFSPDGLIFDEPAIQVEDFYRRVRFHTGAKAVTLPPDHLGLELRCIAHVAANILAAPSAAQQTTLAHSLAEFTAEHPVRFADHVLEGIEAHARTTIYQSLPDLTRGVLAAATSLR